MLVKNKTLNKPCSIKRSFLEILVKCLYKKKNEKMYTVTA